MMVICIFFKQTFKPKLKQIKQKKNRQLQQIPT